MAGACDPGGGGVVVKSPDGQIKQVMLTTRAVIERMQNTFVAAAVDDADVAVAVAAFVAVGAFAPIALDVLLVAVATPPFLPLVRHLMSLGVLMWVSAMMQSQPFSLSSLASMEPALTKSV